MKAIQNATKDRKNKINNYAVMTVKITRLLQQQNQMTGQSKSDRTARSITAFMKSTERTKKCGTKDYIH